MSAGRDKIQAGSPNAVSATDVAAGNQSSYTASENIFIQPKLNIGRVDDPMEVEADAMADKVMRMPDTNFIRRRCAHCEEEEKAQLKPLSSFVQKKEAGGESTVASHNVTTGIDASRGKGNSMNDSTRNFMESRFGANFGGVKIHTNNEAIQLSQELNARAFTVGNDIYFNRGEYQPHSASGKQLLAHELTHTIQQGSVIRRSPKDIFGRPLGFVPTPEQEEYDRQSVAMRFDRMAALMAAEIWFHPVTQRLKDKSKDRVRRIIDMAKVKPPGHSKGQRYYYLEKLKVAITTPFNGVDTGDEDYGCSTEQETENRKAVDKAIETEKRDWDGLFNDVEEAIVASGTSITMRTGAGGKQFAVDRSDPKRIRVLIKVRLKGPAADVSKIRKLEDAIERAVSIPTKGYYLDIRFVSSGGTDVFEMTVKFCQWPNSENWATDPVTLSHEVHHALGLPDRYDYIESHSGNEDMNVASRLEWFEEEMNKGDINNPRSKMATNENQLLNDDVCAVAFDPGADRDRCIVERNAFNPAGKP